LIVKDAPLPVRDATTTVPRRSYVIPICLLIKGLASSQKTDQNGSIGRDSSDEDWKPIGRKSEGKYFPMAYEIIKSHGDSGHDHANMNRGEMYEMNRRTTARIKVKSHIPRSLVASGSYNVSRRKREIIEALLLTCVGVTLCDRQAKVGGLIHLLLPEPPGTYRPWHPEKYASTGLPIFIQSLCDAGADKRRLEAYIAGGALPGPLSKMDLDLDIGGRTTEIVERILKREKIPVIKAETGGFSTYRLSLNLLSWESCIEPLSVSLDDCTKKDSKRATDEEIECALGRVSPIPQITLKIIRMTCDSRNSLRDISKELRKDQILSAKVIRLCNSAFIGARSRIDSIDRALVLLGEKRFLQLVASSSLGEFFPGIVGGYSLCKGGLYQHALGTALISEALANFTGKVPSDIAYTAGLLHDIGKVVLDQYMALAYPLFYRRTQTEGTNLIIVEREEFGVDHTEVGGRLGELWSLPKNLIDTIRHHHNPEEATVAPELSHLVYLADLIMSQFVVGQELERLNTNKLTSRLQRVGIKPEQFLTVIDRLPHQISYDSST